MFQYNSNIHWWVGKWQSNCPHLNYKKCIQNTYKYIENDRLRRPLCGYLYISCLSPFVPHLCSKIEKQRSPKQFSFNFCAQAWAITTFQSCKLIGISWSSEPSIPIPMNCPIDCFRIWVMNCPIEPRAVMKRPVNCESNFQGFWCEYEQPHVDSNTTSRQRTWNMSWPLRAKQL